MSKSLLTGQYLNLHLIHKNEKLSPRYHLYAVHEEEVDREQLLDSIASQLTHIQSQVTLLDRSFPMGTAGGKVDIVAKTGENSLLLAHVQKTLDLNHLHTMLLQKEWVLANYSLFPHLFHRALIPQASGVTFWFFTESVAPEIEIFLKNLQSFSLQVFIYQVFSGPQESILTVAPWQREMEKDFCLDTREEEPFLSPQNRTAIHPASVPIIHKTKIVKLTREEIDDFLQDDVDEITEKAELSSFPES